ncbi:MAG TPA: uracil phosphoribosyltransferase, partial [Acidimicrobiales bacterium]
MGTQVVAVDHPVLAHRISVLRDERTDRDAFRQLVSEISRYLAYEAVRDLRVVDVTVNTPVTQGALTQRVEENVLVVPVLRAGL